MKAQHTVKRLGRVVEQRTVVQDPYPVQALGDETLRLFSRNTWRMRLWVWVLPAIIGFLYFLWRIGAL